VEPGKSFVVADIPGLIEGASEGAGLGHQFLRHIERTRLLVHVLDVSGLTLRDPWEDFQTVNQELARYSDRLAGLKQLVALNKADMPDSKTLVPELREKLEAEGHSVFLISALNGEGVRPLLYAISAVLDEMPVPLIAEAETPVQKYKAPRRDEWEAAEEEDGLYVVRGKSLERLVAMTDMNNEASVRRLQRILEKHGIITKLRELGAEDGDSVRIGTVEFDFID
jgi:GTP-binding protein